MNDDSAQEAANGIAQAASPSHSRHISTFESSQKPSSGTTISPLTQRNQPKQLPQKKAALDGKDSAAPHLNLQAAQYRSSPGEPISVMQDIRSPASNIDRHSMAEAPLQPHINAIHFNRNSCCDTNPVNQQPYHSEKHTALGTLNNSFAQSGSSNLLVQDSSAQGQTRIGVAQAGKRVNSSDHNEKRYKIAHQNSVAAANANHLQTSNNFSSGVPMQQQQQYSAMMNQQALKQIYNSPKPPQNQRLLPERVEQRQASQVRDHAVKTSGQIAAAQANEIPNQPANSSKKTVMGLGLGMGIQMGNDGRFYASMGGVTMPGQQQQAMMIMQSAMYEQNQYQTALSQPSSFQQNLSPQIKVNGTGKSGLLSPKNSNFKADGLVNRQKLSEVNFASSAQNINDQVYKSPTKGKKLPSGRQDQQKGQVKNNKNQQLRRDSKMIKGNLDEYQEIFNSVSDQARQKMTNLQRSRDDSAGAAYPSTNEESSRRSLHMKSFTTSNKRGSSNIDLSAAGPHEDSSLQLGGAASANQRRQRTRDAIGAAQAQQACSDQVYHHSHHVPLIVGPSGASIGTNQHLTAGPHATKKTSMTLNTTINGGGGGPPGHPSDLQNKSQRMNQTNESNFTEQPNSNHYQLIAPATNQQPYLDAAAAHHQQRNGYSYSQVGAMGGGQQQNATTSNGGVVLDQHQQSVSISSQQLVASGGKLQSGDPRPYILMKNRVEEGSKQLKHDVAQQIIQANSNQGTQKQAATITRKNSQQAQQQALPQLMRQKLPKTGLTSPHNGAADNNTNQSTALNHFYQQMVTSDNTDLQQLQGPSSSQLGKSSELAPILTKQHNSMENLLGPRTMNSRNANANLSMQVSPGPLSAAKHGRPDVMLQQHQLAQLNYQTAGGGQQQQQSLLLLDQQQQDSPHFPLVNHQGNNSKGLSYRVMSEKRASQPPLLLQQQYSQLESGIKRNSMQQQTAGLGGAPSQQEQQTILMSSGEHHATGALTMGGGFNNAQQQSQQQNTTQQNEPFLSPENKEWIMKAIEASKQVQLSGSKQPLATGDNGANGSYLSQIMTAEQQQNNQNQNQQQTYQNKTATKQYKQLQMGSPRFQISLSDTNQDSMTSPKQPPVQRADLTDTNVKRTRLLVEKKKKQFGEQMKDPRWRLSHQSSPQSPTAASLSMSIDMQEQLQQELAYQQKGASILIGSGMKDINRQSGLTSHAGQNGNGMMCIPNITYRSILPAQHNQNQLQQSAKIRNLGEHPLNNQQLLNGYSKNVAATTKNVGPGAQRQNHAQKLMQQNQQQERVGLNFSQNQGIQGKNITIMQQNKAFAHQQSLMRQLKQVQENNNLDQQLTLERVESEDAALLNALQSQLNAEDFKALQLIQQQLQKGGIQLSNSSSRKNLLQAMHAAETGQIHSSFNNPIFPAAKQNMKGKESSFFQFGVPRQSQLVPQGAAADGKQFQLVGQGQNHLQSMTEAGGGAGEESSLAHLFDIKNAGPLLQIAAELQQQQQQQQAQQMQSQQAQGNNSQTGMSNASYMADQMVQLSIGSRSLSKMLQGAQLESALQQIAQKAGFLSANAAAANGDQMQPQLLGNASYLQQVTLAGGNPLAAAAALQAAQMQQQSPRSSMKIRGRSERISSKVVKYTSPQKAMKPGESNGSLSTKPTTSTTLGSTTHKEETKEGGRLAPKKGAKKSSKQKVHIYHEWSDFVDSLKNHRINKAINTINNIIRLIFKNSKDSLAITATNHNNNALNGPPANRLMEEYRIVELQKIAKQININIPRKFDSKSSLREFFYSREFILNVKIKMQNLLHKAILSANNLPQSVIEANMCGNPAVATGQAGPNESKIYQAKKFWVGHGNNFPIVKSVLKQRYWWQYGSEESFAADCDFLWTSWKKQKHIDYLTKVNNAVKTKVNRREQQNAASSSLPSSARARANSSATTDQVNSETEQKPAAGETATTTTSATKGKKAVNKKEKQSLIDTKEPQTATPAQFEKIVFPLRLYNKLEQNKQLTNKKGLFINMRKYYESLGQDPFKVLPLTFHTTLGVNDPEFHKFAQYYNKVEAHYKHSEKQARQAIKEYQLERKNAKRAAKEAKDAKAGDKNTSATAKADDDYGSEAESDEYEEAIEKIRKKYRAPQNTWIIKPGENTNRGQGITVVKTIREVQAIIGRPMKKDGDRTFIIQKYIDYPLLVHKRKFDFRCFGLLTSINGSLKGYCYQDGYIRTSCREYSLDDVSDQFIHLTNDAIQQKAEDYGKFENGNKLSWQDFTKVICAQQPELDFDFHRDIFPQIQKLIADTYKAAFHKIDPQRLHNTFELFGYDFMIDENFRLYLIEVNTNPCLEVCCPLLARIIPEVLDNSFKIVLDPLFPSPDLSHNRKFQLNELPQEVKYQLVFDEDVEGEQIRANYRRGVRGSIQETREEDIESDKENELAEDDGEDAY